MSVTVLAPPEDRGAEDDNPRAGLVTATRYRCGCLISTTEQGYVAEEEFCPDGLTLADDREKARAHRRSKSFEDDAVMKALGAVEKTERTLENHRRLQGILEVSERPPRLERATREGRLTPAAG